MGNRRIGSIDQALLVKWLWWFGHEATHLWHQVTVAKYGEDRGRWCTKASRGTHRYGLWQSITAGWDHVFPHVVFVFGEGNQIRFWYDPWSDSLPLKDIYADLFDCLATKDSLVSVC